MGKKCPAANIAYASYTTLPEMSHNLKPLSIQTQECHRDMRRDPAISIKLEMDAPWKGRLLSAGQARNNF